LRLRIVAFDIRYGALTHPSLIRELEDRVLSLRQPLSR
jgi:hypothetical protein